MKKIRAWRNQGYQVIMYYFSLPNVEMAVDRVRHRVRQGGHNIPEKDIRRRFLRSKNNFESVYQQEVDAWVAFDTSSTVPVLIGESKNG